MSPLAQRPRIVFFWADLLFREHGVWKTRDTDAAEVNLNRSARQEVLRKVHLPHRFSVLLRHGFGTASQAGSQSPMQNSGHGGMQGKRAFLALCVLAAIAALELAAQPPGQGRRFRPGMGFINPADNGASTEALTFTTDRKAKQSLGAAEDFIKEESWAEASRILQSLLDTKEDVFIEVAGPKNTVKRVSLRQDADRLLGSLPSKGREFYELQYGPRAKARLAEAMAKGDRDILAEVAQRYFHTAAGAQALDQLGTYYLDRGQDAEAYACFARLLAHERAADLKPLTRFKAAMAAHRVGESGASDTIWQQLSSANPAGIRIGEHDVTLGALHKILEEPMPTSSATANEWQLFRGDAGRSGSGQGGAPCLTVLWAQSGTRQKQSAEWISHAMKQLEDRQEPIVPGYFPIATYAHTKSETIPLVIYRDQWGVHAVDVRNGKLFWEQLCSAGMDKLSEQGDFKNWVSGYLQNGGTQANLLLENSTIGTLSTDGARVYSVDDLVLPPSPNPNMQFIMPPNTMSFGALQEAVQHSKLQAFDVSTGKILWLLGGTGTDKGEFTDTYFLGPPLPLGGKLYVLVEKASELRLLCLDPQKGEMIWSQSLANVRDRLMNDSRRRLRGVHLAYGSGILLCPTNAQALVAVDLLSHSLLWEYSYHDESTDTESNWFRGRMVSPGERVNAKASAPVVIDDRIIYAPPESKYIFCLNLRTGEPIWKQDRNDDLYVGGVYKGVVLIVGPGSCRAVSIQDGKQLWRVETGIPSGEGIASDNMYFLPLFSSGQSHDAEVCSIDMTLGTVIHTKVKEKDVPGNLIFFEGDVISQAPLSITAYPQLKRRLEQIDELIRKDPNDPVGLTDRGELKLDKGDLAGAVADLRTALAHQPPEDVVPRTREKLFDALSLLFRKDFAKAEPYLAEYKEMCRVPAQADESAEDKARRLEKEQRRRANFLGLVADGRRQQGRFSEALDAYLEFASLSRNKEYPELVSAVNDPSLQIRPDAWAAGRIRSLYTTSDAEVRGRLESKATEQWKRLENSKDVDALREFVTLFGSLLAVGRQARLQLATRLLDGGEFLEAELQLLQAKHGASPEEKAKIIGMLAGLLESNKLYPDAAYLYRVLDRDFPSTPVRDGKTGGQLWQAIDSDHRYDRWREETKVRWPARLTATSIPPVAAGPRGSAWTLEPDGPVLPFFSTARLVCQDGQQIELVDRVNGTSRYNSGRLDSSTSALHNQQLLYAYTEARNTYRAVGHLLLVNLGGTVYALDPVNNRLLWDKNLLGSTLGMNNQTVQLDRDSRLMLHLDGFDQKLFQVGPAGPTYVCLQAHDGLVALDPVRGTTLWTKSDVPKRAQTFGDDEHVYWIEMRDGSSGGGHALHAADGSADDIPDFSREYRKHTSQLGRNLLVCDEDGHEAELRVRLYDVQKVTDVWSKTFGKHAMLLRSDEPEITGVVEPGGDGKVTVLNSRDGRELLAAKVDMPADLDKIQAIYLLRDADQFYVVFYLLPNTPANVQSMSQSNMLSTLRSRPVNGKIYAFDRQTGKFRWNIDIKNEWMILTEFEELPVLLLTSSYSKQVFGLAPGRGQSRACLVTSIDKHTGKRLKNEEVANVNPFHTLTSNRAAGTIDLMSNVLRLHIAPEEPADSGTLRTPP
jgi:outer membrane protein assembly factor BamB